jgi:GNAT superfamily N-acetyltransferase
MSVPDVIIEPVGEDNFERTVQFLTEWVSDGEPAAREHLADHATGGGSSLIATRNQSVIGIVTIRWQSNYAGFRNRGIPLVHQLGVAGPFRRLGVATLLMDAAEELARGRRIMTLGITVGLFDEYGPAQRMYARRGYVPDGRGACHGQEPLSKGAQLTVDDDLIIWLTKDLCHLCLSVRGTSGRSGWLIRESSCRWENAWLIDPAELRRARND